MNTKQKALIDYLNNIQSGIFTTEDVVCTSELGRDLLNKTDTEHYWWKPQAMARKYAEHDYFKASGADADKWFEDYCTTRALTGKTYGQRMEEELKRVEEYWDEYDDDFMGLEDNDND